MVSLTPKHRNDEVVGMAMSDGFLNGTLVMMPALGVLYAAMQRPGFVKVTNWQSRTAMVLMPTLFTFVISAEDKMVHRMRQMAEETDHAIKSVEWAERQHRVDKQTDTDKEKLRDLYRTSIMESGVRVVGGEQLGSHHKVANYVQSNPFKIIAGIGIPAVVSIFYGQTGKEHVNMQMKILHTRVFGQFAVVCTLLSVMGLKDMMDRSGRYVTEWEVEDRVSEMEKTRTDLIDRLDYQMSLKPNPHHPKKQKPKKLKHTEETKTQSMLITE